MNFSREETAEKEKAIATPKEKEVALNATDKVSPIIDDELVSLVARRLKKWIKA